MDQQYNYRLRTKQKSPDRICICPVRVRAEYYRRSYLIESILSDKYIIANRKISGWIKSVDFIFKLNHPQKTESYLSDNHFLLHFGTLLFL